MMQRRSQLRWFHSWRTLSNDCPEVLLHSRGVIEKLCLKCCLIHVIFFFHMYIQAISCISIELVHILCIPV